MAVRSAHRTFSTVRSSAEPMAYGVSGRHATRVVRVPRLKADVVARRVLSEADIAGVYLVVADNCGAYQLAKPADAAAVVLIGLIAPVEVLSPDYLRRNATVHRLKH